ncbi:MAG: hypothetical protein IPG45_19465 [Deltaproteobacteria bacterium]|nr:hypothetical protein [Deltaproteobacteria bacterium]
MGRRGWAVAASVVAHGIFLVLAQTSVRRPAPGPSRVQLRLATDEGAPEVPPSRPPAPRRAESPAAPPAVGQRPAPRSPPKSGRAAPSRTGGVTDPRSAPAEAGPSFSSADDGDVMILPARPSGPNTTGDGAGPDGPSLRAQLSPPGPALLPPATPAAPKIALSPRAGGGYVYRDRGFQAEIAEDGTVAFDDHLPVQLGGESTGGLPVATFDLTEAVMMIAGDDPYRADKERFLAATVELRQELCEAAHQENLRTALYELDRRLDSIWLDPRRAASARRQLLFQLWDECLEPAPDTTDLTERTALQARATILGYIEKNLPAGSPSAYPDQELLALNQRRRSRAPFDPYRRGRDAGVDCE